MKIVVDIETIPDQSDNALDRFMTDDVKVVCPFKSKADIGKDLGISPDEYKYIGSDDFKQMWINKKGSQAKKNQANEKWLKTSFDGAYGQICCIAFYADGESYIFSNENEAELLVEFWDKIDLKCNGKPPFFIAHNAKFDLPFIFHRSVINDVRVNKYFNPHGRHDQSHFCTMEAWAGFNGKIGLDRLCSVLGIEGKSEGMSGADVWPEYQKGNLGKISQYCIDDVRATKRLYERLTFQTI